MLEVREMPPFPGAEVPEDFWWALAAPVPLGGMPYPSAAFRWAAAADLGFRSVLCLTRSRPDYDPSPIVCRISPLQDLADERLPDDPILELAALRVAVELVMASLTRREGVIVHCRGGTGRSGTVIGATLVSLGESPEVVAAWLDRVHRNRGRAKWPESQWQRDALNVFSPGT